MSSSHVQDVIAHYTIRHEQRGDLYGNQPFANYGYWTGPEMTLEQASEALTDVVAAAAGLSPGDEVLDVGCGYGAGCVVYARRCRPKSVIGIDVTEIRIQAGKKYIAECGFANLIDIRLGDATHLDFSDASFDKLVSVECAFHFDTRRDFLREAGRVLRPGGTLALTDMIPRRSIDPGAYLRGDKTVQTGLCLDNTSNAYDADVYAGYLREAGFTAIRIESIIDWTRLPFTDALERVAAKKTSADEAASIRRSAARLKGLIADGEDYVLVVARKL